MMKNCIALLTLFLCLFFVDAKAQEKFGSTINVGLGIGGYAGYYHYVGRSLPVISVNYEFDVVPNFTLAPFASISTYSNEYYWGNKNTPYRYYSYRETMIPIGAKGTYYFDQLLNANSKWDFYAAGSIGFVLINSNWDNGYDGDRNHYNNGNPLFLDIHIGSEYHFNEQFGAFLDLSTGVSTIGIAIHRSSES